MRRGQRQRMLAAAEPDFQPQFGRTQNEDRKRVIGTRRVKTQTRQRFFEQAFLARPQLVADGASVEPVGRWLQPPPGFLAQRPKADFSAGTRSVFSQVKVPSSASGSRPKCP